MRLSAPPFPGNCRLDAGVSASEANVKIRSRLRPLCRLWNAEPTGGNISVSFLFFFFLQIGFIISGCTKHCALSFPFFNMFLKHKIYMPSRLHGAAGSVTEVPLFNHVFVLNLQIIFRGGIVGKYLQGLGWYSLIQSSTQRCWAWTGRTGFKYVTYTVHLGWSNVSYHLINCTAEKFKTASQMDKSSLFSVNDNLLSSQ